MSEQLDQLWKDAEQDNVFFMEYSGFPAAAGDVRDYNVLREKRPELSDEEFYQALSQSLGIVVDLCVLGDVKGDDRVANCQSAWDNMKKFREKDPNAFPKLVEARKALGLPIGETKQVGTF